MNEIINPSRIIGIQFSLMSPEEIERNSVAEIVTKETYNGIKPKIGGLFDPRMGVLESGLKCPTDGKNYIHCPGYFGHIKLARPVFYIQYINTIIKILRCVCIKCGKLRISKTMNKNLLKLNSSTRWDKVFQLASKISRCGEDCETGCGCMQPSRIKKEGFATIIAEWDKVSTESSSGEKGKNTETLSMKMTPEIVLKTFKKISDEDVNFMGFSSIWSRPDWMICQTFAVPPPSVRPSVKHDAQQRSEDDLTIIIINIIKFNNSLKDKIEQNANSKMIEDLTTIVQYYVASMVDNKMSGASPVVQRSNRALKSITERHKGKTGRVRGNLMGKRVDFSARSVITPDPELSITELGVPLKIAKNITKPVKVTDKNKRFLYYLLKNGPDKYPGAKILERKNGENISLRYADIDNIVLNNGDTVHRHMMNGDYVLFNRQPTLHRMSMMAHSVKIMKHGDTFRMNVAVTKPYNADFDGDEMNLHMPQNDEAEMELKHLGAIPYQLISPANNESIIGIFQDSLIGSYLFTNENKLFTRKESMNLLSKYRNLSSSMFDENKEYYSSFEILSQILPNFTIKYKNKSFKDEEDKSTSNNIIEIVNGKYVRGQLDKSCFGKSGKGLIQRINNDYTSKESVDFIDSIQNIITEFMKKEGFSVGISDLISNKTTNEQIQKIILDKKREVGSLIDQVHLGILENKTGKSNLEHFETQVNNILNKASNQAGNVGIESLDKSNRFVKLVTSGSKGSIINISQMISCLGQQNVDNKRIPYGFKNRTLPHFNQFDDTPKARGFVTSSFIEGLEPEELFFHAMGGRVGLIDTAVKTSQTGYIQRRLIKGMEDLKICYDSTVRNSKNKIVQFTYGGTMFDTIHLECIQFNGLKENMSDIYERYNYNFHSSKFIKMVFTGETVNRLNSQEQSLKNRIKDDIDMLLESRDEYITNSLKNIEDNKIYLPVSFEHTINNIKHNFGIKQNSLTDITPLEVYELIDSVYNDKLVKMFNPCRMFYIAYYYYLNPKVLLYNHKLTKYAIEFLLEKILYNYKRSIVSPGEMVGMIAAQSIGEPTTQMTLNTFHFAGVSSKSNVTRGVPRIEEILSLTENLKNPSLTIFLNKEDESNIDLTYKMITNIEHTKFKDIIENAEIYYDPDDMKTLITNDIDLLKKYNEFKNVIDDCLDTTSQDAEEEKEQVVNDNKWILRLTIDKIKMIDKNITLEDIYFVLKTRFQDKISCIYNDYNDDTDNIIFRIRIKQMSSLTKLNTILDQEDHIYMIKSFLDVLLNKTVLRGVKNISKVNLRKIPDYIEKNNDNGNYEKKDVYVLDTVGTNLIDILSLDIIDQNRTFSNNIQEMKTILGIEAARQCLFDEIIDVMEFDSTYINHHHIALLCDRMCYNNRMVSIVRHGVNRDDIGPIAKASYEETTEMFIRAAKHGEMDEVRGISANIMCGQEGYYGTSCFSTYVNMNDISKMDEQDYDDDYEEDEIEILNEISSNTEGDDMCSMSNIKTQNTLTNITKSDTIEDDDDYENDMSF